MAKYDKATVERISSGLTKLPPRVEEYTTVQMIEKLEPQIREVMEKGYTIPEIVAWLNENGVKVTLSTFKTYLAGVGKEKPKGASTT